MMILSYFKVNAAVQVMDRYNVREFWLCYM